MPWLSAFGAACGLFVSTNVDQLVLLVAWSADSRLSFRRILLGHMLGIGSLVGASLLVSLGAAELSPVTARLLGLVPLCLGLAKLRQAWLDRGVRKSPEAAAGPLSIALVTIASGGDNVAAYVPMLRVDDAMLALDAAVFGAMSVLWCAAARALVRQRRLRPWIARASPWLTPVVLMVLGAAILGGVRPK
jgi:cadmium resistance protein CadD (predicted permease)